MEPLERLEVHRAFESACQRRAWARARAACLPWWAWWRRLNQTRRAEDAGSEADVLARRLREADAMDVERARR